MKNSTPQTCRLIVSAIFAVAATLSATAQKLPGVQKTSIYAPANVKTDGKATEWNDKFEAMNSATGLYYTIANDGDKLYLTVQGKDIYARNKMLNGGITFTIKSADKNVKPLVFELLVFQHNSLTDVAKKVNNPDAKMDSLLTPINEQLANGLKEIGVKGVNDITDTLISVYNEHGIKEAVQYNSNKALTCEFAIPLKYISHLATADGFKYNVKLNAVKMSNVKVVMNGAAVAPGSAGEMKAASLINTIALSGNAGSDAFSDTGFSGNYALAKK